MTETMKPVYCCGKPTEPVYNATRKQHSGWWCKVCNNFQKSTGREFKFPMQLKEKNQ